MTGKEEVEQGIALYQRLEALDVGPLARAVSQLETDDIQKMAYAAEHINDLARIAAMMKLARVKPEDLTDEVIEQGFVTYKKVMGQLS